MPGFNVFNTEYLISKDNLNRELSKLNNHVDLRSMSMLVYLYGLFISKRNKLYELKQLKIGKDFYNHLDEELEIYKNKTSIIFNRIITEYESGTIRNYNNEYYNNAKYILTNLTQLEKYGITINLSKELRDKLMIMKLSE